MQTPHFFYKYLCGVKQIGIFGNNFVKQICKELIIDHKKTKRK